MERVAPRQVMYENQLPLAIESKSQRRKFYPEGATTFGPQGNAQGNSSTIRIPINADSLLDVQHSYLQFKLTNNSGRTIGTDIGMPIIRRLRIESAGTTLEDIQEYGRLYGAVLFPSQAGLGAVREGNICQMGLEASNGAIALDSAGNTASATGALANFAAGTAGEPTDAELNAAFADIKTKIDAAREVGRGKVNNITAAGSGLIHAGEAQIANGASRTYNLNLVSGLLNMDKYLPLVMMNAGIVLELELSTALDIGVSAAGGDPIWSVSDVRYVGHLIDLQRDFYDKLRMVMEGSGSVLQLTGTTYRTFSQSHVGGANTSYSMNIPARMKSIKSIFFIFQNQTEINRTHFNVASALPNGVSEYQFRVGSVMYPPESVKGSVDNKGEFYQELRKAFGTLGDYQHGGVLLENTSFYAAAGTDTAIASGVPTLTPYALDFESFPKTSLENGINSADRSLPITLDVKRSGGVADAIDSHIFVMCDAVFYVNLDGSVSVSI